MMSLKKTAPNQKSIVVPIDFPTRYTVYKALVSLTCCGCSEEIKPGKMFTRRGDKAGTVLGIRYHFCLTCRPIMWSGNQ
jgi:hypothetical protein